jgi:hypothetical protein
MSAHGLTTHTSAAHRRLRSIAALTMAAVVLGGAAAARASATVTFAPASAVPGVTGASVLTAGDLDGDGRADIVAPSYGADSVFVALGEPGGAFSAGTPFSTPVDGGPVSAVVDDFDGDKHPDVVAGIDGTGASPLTARLAWYRGDGSGGLETPVLNALHVGAYALASGEFYEDGDVDIAYSGYSDSRNAVGIVEGDGEGYFLSVVDRSLPGNPAASGHEVAVDDVNEDGHLDVVVAGGPRSGGVYVLLGDGHLGLSQPQLALSGAWPTSIALADFNGDGHKDMAAADARTNHVTIGLGDGAGNFSPTTLDLPGDGTTDAVPNAVAAGDFNGDGNADIATLDEATRALDWFVGDGSGHFAPAGRRILDRPAVDLVAKDLNGDGLDDLVANEDAGPVDVFLDTSRPAATLSSDRIEFGDPQPLGTAAPAQSVTITNTGDAPLHPRLAVAGDDFQLAGGSCPAAAVRRGASCTVQVSFVPGAAGERSGSLTISSDDPAGDRVVELRGTGAAGAADPAGGDTTPQDPPHDPPAVPPAGVPASPTHSQATVRRLSCRPVGHGRYACRLTGLRARVRVGYELRRGRKVYARGVVKARSTSLLFTVRPRKRLRHGRYTVTAKVSGGAAVRTALVVR